MSIAVKREETVNLPNPQDLDALLAVLRARGVVGFELTGADGKIILQLVPDVAPAAPPGSLCEVVEPAGGGWKVPR